MDPAGFDLVGLAESSEGFTGAGIEQAVVSALYGMEGETRGLDTRGLLAELGRTQPLSVIMDVQIQALRAWAKGRTVPAHGPIPAREAGAGQ